MAESEEGGRKREVRIGRWLLINGHLNEELPRERRDTAMGGELSFAPSALLIPMLLAVPAFGRPKSSSSRLGQVLLD